MGLNLVYMADGDFGHDPFKEAVKTTGAISHGHLAAANNHGGLPTSLPDPSKAPDGGSIANGVAISAFTYLPGDMSTSFAAPPVIDPGQSLHFGNFDAPAQILHTVTACRLPCTGSTGISYPLANGDVDFDSGQLGYGPQGYTPAAQRADWFTPSNLPPGTYTYFCRVHPFMRGVLRPRRASIAPATLTSMRSAAGASRAHARGPCRCARAVARSARASSRSRQGRRVKSWCR